MLDRRVNGLGVAESTLQTVGEKQLVLQLPGVTDPTRAARVLGTTALLEFRAQKPGTEEEVQSLRQLRGQLRSVLAARSTADGSDDEGLDQEALNQVQKELGLEGTASSEQEQLEQLLDRTNREIADRFEPTDLTGKDLVGAGRQQQQNSPGWEVTLNFNAEGGEKFAELTKSIAGTGRLLGIVLDGTPISEATVGPQYKAAGISGGTASITGNFTAEEAVISSSAAWRFVTTAGGHS